MGRGRGHVNNNMNNDIVDDEEEEDNDIDRGRFDSNRWT